MLEKNSKGKSCIFFASDYHFELISISYIRENLSKNKKVVILAENNLTHTLETILQRINIEDKESQKILQIDWSNNPNKIQEITKDSIVFIKGSKKYIEETNEKIKEQNIHIIDCYDINEIGANASNISNKYDEILLTRK